MEFNTSQMIKYYQPIIQKDLETLHKASLDWSALKNKRILVTGATGMLASYFSFMIKYLNEQDFRIKLYVLARSKNKLEQFFGTETDLLKFIVQDACDTINIHEEIDYIIHAAGAASPYHIINDPVGIIKVNTLGTINVLELARKAKTQKVIFTSTREIYGKVNNKEQLSELDMGITDPLDARSCYPESKRIAETLFKSYSIQYGIPFNTMRIAHTYGPGMQLSNDGRVMADLLHEAINSQDIHLKSDGTAERAFCYLTDAIEAMFRVLLLGKNNEAYNIANETEPITILELANLIQKIAENKQSVKTETSKTSNQGYCNYKRVKLLTSKTEALGWYPKVSLAKGISNTLESFK